MKEKYEDRYELRWRCGSYPDWTLFYLFIFTVIFTMYSSYGLISTLEKDYETGAIAYTVGFLLLLLIGLIHSIVALFRGHFYLKKIRGSQNDL